MDKLNQLKEILGIQGDDGNWNYDPYMHGMYNGMEYAVSLLEDREPVYKEAPHEWLADRKLSDIPIDSEKVEL